MNQLTARPPLRLVPATDATPAPVDPIETARQQGVLDTLAEQLDVRYQALANLTRLEAMDLPGLETAARIIDAIIRTKRNERTPLRLAASAGELVTA